MGNSLINKAKAKSGMALTFQGKICIKTLVEDPKGNFLISEKIFNNGKQYFESTFQRYKNMYKLIPIQQKFIRMENRHNNKSEVQIKMIFYVKNKEQLKELPQHTSKDKQIDLYKQLIKKGNAFPIECFSTQGNDVKLIK